MSGWKDANLQGLTSTTSRQGNFIKPISHRSYTSDQLHIISQGYGLQGFQASKFIFDILKGSLIYLLNSINKQQLSLNEVSEKRLTNLVQSCIQQFNKQNINGSCSFAICCFWKKQKNMMTFLKTKHLQCYVIQNNKIIPISSSTLPFKIKKSSNTMKGFICNGKQYSISLLNTQLFFVSQELKGKQKYILMGTSCIFNHYHQEQILAYLQKDKNLFSMSQDIMNEAKKRWRTIYQQDMSLIIAKIRSQA